MRIRPGRDETPSRRAARAGWRPLILACALLFVGAPPCAAGASPNRVNDALTRPALRDIEFAYSPNRDRWPASRSIAFSCAQCTLATGPGGAARHELRAGQNDARAGGGAVLLGTGQRAAGDGGHRSSWRVLLGAHVASVAADSYTTRRALHSGASEANPMYAWAGDGGALAARLAVGGGVTLLLHHLHKDHPGLARALAVAAIFANVATSWSNDRLARSNESP